MSIAGIAAYIYTVLLKPAPLRFIANKILLSVIPKTVRVTEGVITLHSKDPVISGALAFGVYEPFQIETFRTQVQAGDVVLDIGANIGLYTVIAAGRVGEAGAVFSFEPEDENYALLTKNIKANNFTNTQAVNCAVSNENGTATLSLAEDNKGNHSLLSPTISGATQQVTIVRIDDWLRENKVEKVNVIKMDIQGAEPHALEGMRETMTYTPILFIEYEPALLRTAAHDPIQMLTGLQSYGYDLYDVNEGSRSLVRIENGVSFTASLKGDAYANILAIPQP